MNVSNPTPLPTLGRHFGRDTPQARALLTAAIAQDVEAARVILEQSGGSIFTFSTLQQAIKVGHTEMVALVLSQEDPGGLKWQNEAELLLPMAAEGGRLPIARLLMPLCRKRGVEKNGRAYEWDLTFEYAVIGGNAELVSLLLPQCDPTDREAYALRSALVLGHEAVVAVLLPLSPVVQVFETRLQDEDWRDVDNLSPYVPLATARAALAVAPSGQLPQLQARVLESELAVGLPNEEKLPPVPSRRF